MGWTPPPLEPWVASVNAIGRNLGDNGTSIVSLDDDAIIEAAVAGTGLADFGDDWWREPFSVLLGSLREEADLTLAGRLLARGEVQRLLQSRLRLVDAWSRDPSLAEGAIPAPIFVTGLGRSGTTFLHELLAEDPANRVPMLWETMYPVPPPTTATYTTDPRIGAAHDEIRVMDAMIPAFTAMHENAGDLPTECIFIFAHQFVCDMFLGQYNCPTYAIWQSGIDKAPLYEFHRKTLSLLQSRHAGARWVLKAPSHLSQLANLFSVYPDARVVITHRDPLKVVGSLADLMATLQAMRTDHVDYDAIIALIAFGSWSQLDRVTDDRDTGALPDAQIADVVYRDLVSDPIGTVHALYDRWGLEVSHDYAAALERHVQQRAQHRHGAHEYRFEDTGLDLATERARVAPYQERYGVPSEVS